MKITLVMCEASRILCENHHRFGVYTITADYSNL